MCEGESAIFQELKPRQYQYSSDWRLRYFRLLESVQEGRDEAADDHTIRICFRFSGF
jgi:hypothetical protein